MIGYISIDSYRRKGMIGNHILLGKSFQPYPSKISLDNFWMPSFIICDGINSFMQSTMVLNIRSLIQSSLMYRGMQLAFAGAVVCVMLTLPLYRRLR